MLGHKVHRYRKSKLTADYAAPIVDAVSCSALKQELLFTTSNIWSMRGYSSLSASERRD